MPSSIEAALEALVDLDRAERESQFCFDPIEKCDLCGKAMSKQPFAIDGEVKHSVQTQVPDGTTMGQWGYMCAECFSRRGVGIGWGTGQLYRRAENGGWLLVAGFPPDGGAA